MYEQFYGLNRPPFAVTPDPSLLYMSHAHREALATIIYGIETRKGFIVCSGEVGTGKTTVIRAFFDQARTESFKIIYLFTPQVSPLEMAGYICRELDVAVPESVFAAVPALQLKLLEIFEGRRTTVLMIDEAQLLPAETIEFLRLLSNFETDTEKLIQIVLVGQPELDAVLGRYDMRQVAQRIALRARLGAFSPDESLAYIEYRLCACGARTAGEVLSLGAARIIAEAAGGIPRRINILADNVLISGFGVDQRPVGSRVAAATVREFIANSGGEIPPFLAEAGAAVGPEPDWPHFVEPMPLATAETQAEPVPVPEAKPEPAPAPEPEPEPEPELPVSDASLWETAPIVPAVEWPVGDVVRSLFPGGRRTAAPSPAGEPKPPLRPHQRFRPRTRGIPSTRP